MDFQEQTKLRQRLNIALKEPLTLDELYTLMTERWDTEKYGNFKIENFLFVKSIRFDDYLYWRFEVQVTGIVGKGKNLMVTIRQTTGGNPHPGKIKFLHGREHEETRIDQLKHLESLCDAMWEVLSDKVAEKQLFNV